MRKRAVVSNMFFACDPLKQTSVNLQAFDTDFMPSSFEQFNQLTTPRHKEESDFTFLSYLDK